MNNDPITPQEILSALANDSSYGHPHIIDQVQQYIVVLPDLFANQLDEPVTLQGFLPRNTDSWAGHFQISTTTREKQPLIFTRYWEYGKITLQKHSSRLA